MGGNLMALDRKIVQFLLRLGLVLSVVLMMSGLISLVVSDSTQVQSISLSQIFGNDLSLGNRLLGIGIFVLAMTPAVRVLTLVFLWSREKDWKFVGVAVFVLLTLTVSILLGGG